MLKNRLLIEDNFIQLYTTILELNEGDELIVYLKATNSGHTDQQDPQNICIIWELDLSSS